MERLVVNKSFTVAKGAPSVADIENLSRDGYRVVVNLRVPGEEGEVLTPIEEGKEAARLGLAYLHVPVPGGIMTSEAVDAFRRDVSAVTGPVFVHCASGKRSMACTLIHLGLKEGLSADDVLARAEENGFAFDPAPLERFIRDYVERNRQAYERLERNMW